MNGHTERSSADDSAHNRWTLGEGSVVSLPGGNRQEENVPHNPAREWDLPLGRPPTRDETRLSVMEQEHVRVPRHEEEEMAVRLPEREGGRLESDRIILADGTAILLFDNEEEREVACKKDRERQDEVSRMFTLWLREREGGGSCWSSKTTVSYINFLGRGG